MLPSDATDEVLITRPQARSRIRVSAACAHRNVPFRLTDRTWSHCSSVILWLIASRLIPALLTSTSRRPNSPTMWLTSASTSVRCVTSAAIASARAPCRSSSAATGPASPVSTSLTTTMAPSRANRRAVAAPMPFPAPVISATRPSSLIPHPAPAAGRADPPRSGEAHRAVEIPPDDDAQDLAGAPAPEQEARVPEVPLHRVLRREGVRGEDPGGLVADPVGGLRREELGHRGFPGHRPPLVDAPRGVVHEQARGVELREHVGEPERHRLVLADRLAEGDALLRVAERRLVRR